MAPEATCCRTCEHWRPMTHERFNEPWLGTCRETLWRASHATPPATFDHESCPAHVALPNGQRHTHPVQP